jgi:hypothetical protein
LFPTFVFTAALTLRWTAVGGDYETPAYTITGVVKVAKDVNIFATVFVIVFLYRFKKVFCFGAFV